MSFLQNDAASCSANNALNKFSTRTAGDASINRQLQANYEQNALIGQAGQPSFNKLGRIDPSVQNEFNSFRAQPQHSLGMPGQVAQQASFQQPLQNDGQWVSDFQRMNINDRVGPKGMQHQQQGSAIGWSAEFGAGMSQQVSQTRVQQASSLGFRQTYAPVSRFQSSLGTTGATLSQQTQSTDSAFDSAFKSMQDQIDEGQMEMDPVRAQMGDQMLDESRKEVKPIDESEKIKFAQLAQAVFDTMSDKSANVSQETSNKFRQSRFLNLMDRVAKREVEINDKQNKFIDSQGHDIRDDLPDPLRDLRV